MKVTIKETRIAILDVQIEIGAAKAQVEDEIRKQLLNFSLEWTTSLPREGSFALFKDSTIKDGNKLATCEVVKAPTTQCRDIVSIEA